MSRGWSAMLGLLGGLAVLAGVIVVHKLTREDLDRRGHYIIKLADLQVPAPPGMSRETFIAEVLYNRGLPEKFDRTDPAVASKIQQAFAAHPWVEKATVRDMNAPQPVELVIRAPIMVVGDRVLDHLGVVLPLSAKKDDLPVFRGEIKTDAPPSGQPFGDANIRAVAGTLRRLKNKAPALKWQAFEFGDDGLVLIRADGAKAVWGFSKKGEPSDDQKLARLLAWKDGAIDLRKND